MHQKKIHFNLYMTTVLSVAVLAALFTPWLLTDYAAEHNTPHSSIRHQLIETGIFSMYLGIMLVMLFYNAFIYVNIKEACYIFYILYSGCLIVWQASTHAHSYAYLWPDSPLLAPLSGSLALSFAGYCALQFSRYFLSIHKTSKYIDIVFSMGSWLALLVSVFMLFVSQTTAVTLSLLLLTGCITLSMITGILNFKAGDKTVRFFLLSWCFLLLGVLMESAHSMNVLNDYTITNRPGLFGTLLASVLLSLALADRANNQREQNQQMLESTKKQLKINNAELSKALSKIERSNLIKDQFLGTISHELRTPMNSVAGALSLVDTSTLDSQQNHYLDIARISTQEITSLIDSILRFSEIQSGRLQITTDVFELRALLNPVEMKFRHQCQQKGLQFSYHIDKDIPGFIIGDSEHILLILTQLINNAIKFTDHGSIKVNIWKQELPQKSLCFTVSDTGTGISPVQREGIFDEFHQLDNNDNRKHSGLGIGLTLCNQLAKKMAGTLQIESAENKHTTVTFAMPLRPSKAKQAEQTPDNATTYTRQKTILIAEDNLVNQFILKSILQQTDCMILTANNGEQVLQVLETQPVDLIMMDCQMPVIDGFETTRIIRRNNTAYSDVPIIAVTANAMTSDNIRCLSAGMNDYIKKPVNSDAVITKTMRWLQRDKLATIPLHTLSE